MDLVCETDWNSNHVQKSTNSSSAKRSCLGSSNTMLSKRRKQNRAADEHEERRIASTSAVKNEDWKEETVPSGGKLLWNNQWLEFKETPNLEETKIDTRSTLKWCPNFISAEEGDALFDHLMEELSFEHTSISMYGKPVNLPRLQSWFADEGLVVKELFQKQKQHSWTPPMRKLKAQLERQLGVEFDYCLVNLYRDGNDYINFHADNEAKDVIASMTLGATRRFLVRHLSRFGKTLTRKRKPLTSPTKKQYEFSLTNGSLIVMLGDTQQYWKHSVPKEKEVSGRRINLTFRIMQDK